MPTILLIVNIYIIATYSYIDRGRSIIGNRKLLS